MPFSRSTLTQIAARVKTDVQGALEGTAAFFRRSFERGMTAGMTGVSHELHGHLDWNAKQMDPAQADFDTLQTIHGTPRGVYLKDPVAAQFTATDSGTNGTIVPQGTVYQRSDDVRYTVDEDATVALGVVTLSFTAETADAASNVDVDTVLLISAPIAGLTGEATFLAETTTGTDTETQADYLARVLQRMQEPPKGGAEGDFERWALEGSTATRAWEYPRREGAGTVTLYAVDDNADPITLDAPALAVISDYCDQPGRQPVTMDLLVYTPTLQDVPLEINISPDTADVRAAIILQLKATFSTVGNPGGMTLKLSKLNEAISIATGEDDHELVLPAANVVLPFGSMPVFDEDAIVWGTL